MKKISVLISAYNAKNFIGDAVKSVLCQNLPANYAVEIIVGIDGCSETWEIVHNIKHRSVKFIKMAGNYGSYITFNTLMSFATGNLIARFDADDLMLPNYLLNQINIFENDNKIGITRTWSIYTDLNYYTIQAKLANGKNTRKDGKRKAASDGQLIMKREVWDTLGSYKPWRCFADCDFITRARMSNIRIHEVKDFLYVRRVHNQSLTQQKETGYGSPVRVSYAISMKQDMERHIFERNFFVNPTLGNIEAISQLN